MTVHSGGAPRSRQGGPPTATEVGLAGELAAAVQALDAAGVASPRSDAEQLAAHVLAVPRGRLALVGTIPAATARRLAELVDARAARVPLQHLTGLAGFRYRTLQVGPGVFIPRPETESVVGWAVDEVRRRRWPAGPVCVDLCSGCGAIALALADELPGARVHAVEADPGALGWLRRNVAAAGLPVTVHEADVGVTPEAGAWSAERSSGQPTGWASGPVLDVLADLVGRVDLVISNPPYLPDGDRGWVEPEVGVHDPPWALWAGPDGLAGLRAVLAAARELVRPGGLLAVEHADGHGRAARDLIVADGGWDDVVDRPDLAGRDRFVTARSLVAPPRIVR
jgi:release factor glutamine methyltransferase